ncbi:dipeptide/oligopeptide/nickel ABC transporter permease/ATP-binding protein [Microbacterium sp.]|uniref:dipeptide/oligopeptide/nickel ABC transporter permease/ATP-binding protein n=1 Tax=Microbacterium sp. TaxID=51671 RepID=UPI00092BD0B2|nr:dipeptide/oligopeptide/nickel ABC transporter permease/ATP-binding protein [Microbacterium sp.]MBN9187398.1 dipeptide/oligopeptide/nickel ABC transporter permease/ATP-binding protein [Microbacterium sp.]MBN9193905.1 dipeptide/oligopeptide/nickel ABC transporter permease/ATP-binding protein [Microbacterium sp.]OJU70125.1 MAG: ABC transporter [Microbacterium sp. 70-38]
MTVADLSAVEVPAARRGVVQRLLRNPLGVVSIAILLIAILAAVLAPVLPLHDPNLVSLRDSLLPPGHGHLLGTDASGRDVLSRLVWGSQIALLGAALATGVAVVVGLPSGLVAGYYGGWFDAVASWVTNLNMALPGIVLLIAVRAVVGPSVWISMAIFGVLLAPGVFRIVRAAVQSVRNELYVDAARVSGLGDARIIGRHVMWVVRAPVVIACARLASIAIAVQAGLEFLGIISSNVPSWGGMLNDAFRRIYSAPLLIFWPSLVVGLVIVALMLLGGAIRDALEDRDVVVRRRANTRVERSAHAAPVQGVADDARALLTVRDLRVGYGLGESTKIVVEDVSLEVAEGEVLGLVGESGSGKSQTAFAVLGLLAAGGAVTGGSIRFSGVELTTATRAERSALRGTGIAYVPQEPMSNLDPSFTIGQQLTVPIRACLGVSRREAKHRALALLARVGLPDPAATFRSYPHEISGGMAQRVLIAGAVSCDPRLIIADEPTTALDVTVQAEVLDLLRDLQSEFRMGMLLITHNFGVVADICDRVAVMSRGRIVETGRVEDILTNPQHEYTRELLGSMLEEAYVRPDLDAPAAHTEGAS